MAARRAAAAARAVAVAATVLCASSHASGAHVEGTSGVNGVDGGGGGGVSLSFSKPVLLGEAMWMSDSFWRLGPVPGMGDARAAGLSPYPRQGPGQGQGLGAGGAAAAHAVVIGALDLPAPRSEEPPGIKHHYTYAPNMMTAGHDACHEGPYTLAAAKAKCIALPDCIGFTFSGNESAPTGVIPKVRTAWRCLCAFVCVCVCG